MACYFAVWSVFVAAVARPWTGPPAVVPPGRNHADAARCSAPAPALTSPLLRSRWNLWFAFLGAAAWVGLEWVRGWMFSGFGWNDLGVGLHAGPAVFPDRRMDRRGRRCRSWRRSST